MATRPRRATTPAAGVGMSEEDFKRRVIDTAKLMGWMVHHCRPARTEKGWRTPVEGHAGFPDLALARDGVVILAELKTDKAQPTLNQRAWLGAAGGHARLWHPADWPEIFAELSQHRHPETGVRIGAPAALG